MGIRYFLEEDYKDVECSLKIDRKDYTGTRQYNFRRNNRIIDSFAA
jgi:hypothetical protein